MNNAAITKKVVCGHCEQTMTKSIPVTIPLCVKGRENEGIALILTAGRPFNAEAWGQEGEALADLFGDVNVYFTEAFFKAYAKKYSFVVSDWFAK